MRCASMCDPGTLLELWERGLAHRGPARADALVGEQREGISTPRTVGERNTRLIELHARLFGREVQLLSHCPACGTAAEFTADCEALAAQMRPDASAPPRHCLETFGHRVEFRLPDGADVVVATTDADRFTDALLERCVLASTCDGVHVPATELPAPVLDALSQRMEALDPGATTAFALVCPECGTRWQASLDVGEMVWHTIRTAAERLLLDIDTLARAYGWTEPDVLRLTPLRRAAYLQMVSA
jgi:hypothetical protein